MLNIGQLKEISNKTESKIIMLIMDGLGGLPDPGTNKTELETAIKPNLNKLAKSSICGLSVPVGLGITPGSGPGHLALFGYSPMEYMIGRGILEAIGINFDIKKGDIAARGNFCTIDKKGYITDRRAGRITTDQCTELCSLLRQIKIDDVEIYFEPVKDHRFLFIIRGKQLSEAISDSDPQSIGVAPLLCLAKNVNASATATIINNVINQAALVLNDKHPANMLLLRGFSSKPEIPSLHSIFKLNPAAIARYPMYKGLAKLVGMKIYDVIGDAEEQIKLMQEHYQEHDFFFIHIKDTDSSGEDGDFQRKVKAIEKVDNLLLDI
jgi:2,3-bisphosphoglycerate-independent phosphoglycerate mutase